MSSTKMSRNEKAKSGLLDSWFGRPKKNAPGGHAGSGTSLSSQDSGRPASLHYTSGNLEEDDSGGGTDHIAYKDIVNNFDERQVDEHFEEMLTNMNLSEEKKEPLRAYTTSQKRNMLIAYKGVNSHEGRSKFEKPSDYLMYLNQPDLTVNKLTSCLENLRISLKNNPLSWVEDFVNTGVDKLITMLNNCYSSHRDERYTKLQLECLKCLSAIMNNTIGIRAVFACESALTAIARSVDPSKQLCMLEAVKVLAVTCLIPNGHEKVLKALTIAGDPKTGKRFVPIIKGLNDKSSGALKVACMQLINAIINTADDLDFRLHLRNEIMRMGFYDTIDDFKKGAQGDMRIQIDAFENEADEDHEEFLSRFDNAKMDMEDINECFELVKNLTMETAAEPYLLSILQHLLFIRDDHLIRPAYYKLIEECISQIVLTKNGYDPDFRQTRFNIDIQPLIDGLIEKTKVEDDRKMEDMKRQLEEALAAKQEAEGKAAHFEERLQQSQQPGSNNLTHSSIAAIAKSIGSPGGPPPPIPPPMPGGAPIPPPMSGAPIPPPMPGGGPIPPPPPMMPGGGGIPPPPPMFGGPGIPPPPPMFGGPGGPPPPPFGAPQMPRPDVLPHGLQPKRKWELEGGVALKRANWKTIIPQKMSEKSFWVKVREESLASPDILTGLAQKFSSKPAVKKTEDSVDRIGGTMKKVKDLKVLDAKAAQNISILLGGSLKHMSYSAVRKCIMKCDTNILNANVLDLLIQYLPRPEQLKKLLEFKDSYKDLTEAEQFAVTIADIKRLLPRLKSLSFKEHYKELIQEVKPDIVSGTEACEEIKKSAKFAKILELVLLLGNYMNTGSRNAGAFGFEISFLTKLTATKDLENKQTLLHYLVSTIENKFPDVLTFAEEIPHADRASRVSIDNLQKSLKKMDSDVKNLETDLLNSKVPQDEDDKFYSTMASFAEEARKQCDVLRSMLKKMEALYSDLAEFYVFDQAKYTLEDFFGDIKSFKDSFSSAHMENLAVKEAEEKAQRAKQARLLADREKEERAQRVKQLVNIDAQQDGVMDSLMEALSSGSAFSRERQRKKGPRIAGAERRAQLSRSRSRSGLVGPLTTRELSSEILGSA